MKKRHFHYHDTVERNEVVSIEFKSISFLDHYHDDYLIWDFHSNYLSIHSHKHWDEYSLLALLMRHVMMLEVMHHYYLDIWMTFLYIVGRDILVE